MYVGLALRSWWQFFASFAVKKNLTAKKRQGFAKDAKQWCVVWLCVLGDVLCELCGKEELNREQATDSQRTQSNSLGQGGK